MLMKIVKTVSRVTNTRFYFGDKPVIEPLKSFLTHEQIKLQVPEEEYQLLVKAVSQKESQVLTEHQERIKRVQSILGAEEKARVQRIAQLVSGLNETETEYIRYKLLSTVQVERQE